MTRYIRSAAPYVMALAGVLLLWSGVSLAEHCADADLWRYIVRALAGLSLCGAVAAWAARR